MPAMSGDVLDLPVMRPTIQVLLAAMFGRGTQGTVRKAGRKYQASPEVETTITLRGASITVKSTRSQVIPRHCA
jgi:hypothetical protein